jgi:RND family efflux transporter MFP subunit
MISESNVAVNESDATEYDTSTQTTGRGILVRLLNVGLSLAILAGAVFVAMWLLQTAPKSKRRKPPRMATLVNVIEARFVKERVVIASMGTVFAARQVDIYPRVRGEVVYIGRDLLPGGLFRRGRVLLRIDQADYRLAVRQSESNVAQNKANLTLEMGRQSVAKREYAMLGEDMKRVNADLALRKPQLASARATFEAAEAALARAKLDLQRTTIHAPFNAIVQTRSVNIGSRVSESSVLARLVDTDVYWIEISVPVDRLKWIQIPQGNVRDGSAVKIYDANAWGQGVYREGKVIKLDPSLEPQGRMARLLVEVRDPLILRAENANKPRLLLGSYVRAEIEGRELPSVFPLPREYLREEDQVWLMSSSNQLEIRRVQIAYRGENSILVSGGIRPGEKIVTTLLAMPVEGMPLRIRGAKKPSQQRKGVNRAQGSLEQRKAGSGGGNK